MVATLLAALTVFALVVFSSNQALSEQRMTAAAVDLQLATITVAAADSLVDLGQPLPESNLRDAIDQLRADRGLALGSLPPARQLEAGQLLDRIADTGVALLEDREARYDARDLQRIEEILRGASSTAAGRAAAAEQRRALLLGLLTITLVGAGWLVVRFRIRSAERQAVASVQLESGRRLERLLNDTPDIFLVLDRTGGITYRSASAARLLAPEDHRREDLLRLVDEPVRADLAAHLDLDRAGGASETFELVDRHGDPGWFEIRVSDLTADQLVSGHLITARDITNEVHLRHDLFSQAHTDVLTGLPNRRALDHVLAEASAGLADKGGLVALISLDLDGFKDVNDTLGHEAGDDVLVQVSSRLRGVTRSTDVLMRLGGDEFAVIVPALRNLEEAERVAYRYLQVLESPIRLGSRLEQLRTSVGLSVTNNPAHVRLLVGEADVAMYAAKRSGGSRVSVFEPSMEDDVVAGSRISRALRTVDHDREFRVVYQPIVTVDGARLVGLEALLRWDSPVLGPVPPGEFIPVSERSGDICSIGNWVLDTVCRQIGTWDRAGADPSTTVSCNVSAHQLTQDDFVAGVLATLERWSVDPERLTVEITESAVLDHTGLAVKRLHELRAAGVRISIDDFGSGYSNLGQLLRVPFDVLKIDRSLLLRLSEMREQAGDDPTGPCAIMEAIASIASVFGAPVVCEGVETEVQRRSLAASGISYVQGWLTGRPVAPDVIAGRFALDGWQPLVGVTSPRSAGSVREGVLDRVDPA